MRVSDNPILAILQRYEWRWIPASQICEYAKCTEDDIEITRKSRGNVHAIEKRDDKYRFIGNMCAEKHKTVWYLKEQYPSWCSSNQVIKGSGVDKSPGMLRRWSDLLPVEIKTETYRGQRYQMYRYVPDDARSLCAHRPMKHSRKELIKRQNASRQRIIDVLKNHPDEWMTARKISDELNIQKVTTILSPLRSIVALGYNYIETSECDRGDGQIILQYRYVRGAEA